MTNKQKNPNELHKRILEVLKNVSTDSTINRAEVVNLIEELQNNNSLISTDFDIKFREHLNNMQSAVSIYEVVDNGKNFKYVECNPLAEKIENIKREKIIGKNITDVFPGVIESGLLDVLKKVWRTGIPQNYSVSICDDERILEWRENYIYNLPSGEIVIVYQDVTEQKRLEIAAQKSELNYKSLINNKQESFWSIDSEYNLIVFNDFFKKQFFAAYGIELERGINILDVLSSELFNLWKEKYDYALAGKRIVFEFSEKIDKKVNFFKVSLNPIIYRGKITGVTASSIDITKRIQEARSLEESEAKYRSIFENDKMIMLLLDPKSKKIVDANPGAEKFYGWTRDELKKMKITHIEKLTSHQVKERMNLVTNSKSNYFEFEHTKKDNSVCDVSVIKGDININDKKLFYILVTDITEKKKAEEDLKASESLFRNLSKSTATAIFVYQDEKFVFVNEATESLTGYSQNELLKMNFWDVVHPELKEITRKRGLARQKGEHVPNRYQLELIKKNGSIAWIDFTGGKINWSGKEAAIGSAIDITELKTAEEKLKQSEERYEIITDSTSDYLFSAIIPKNGNSKIDWVAGSFKKITGYTLLEFQKKGSWAATIHPKDAKIYSDALETLKNNKKVEIEVRIFNKKGKIVWVRHSTSPVWSVEENRVVSIYGAVKDITEEKKANRALQKSEERYKLITNLTSDYIFSVSIDKKGRSTPTWIGGSFEEISGYTFEEFKERGGWIATVHPDDLEKDKAAFEKLMNNEKVVVELRTIHKSGKIVWVESYGSPVWDKKKNRLVGINGAVRDITMEKLAFIALHESEEKYKLISSLTSDYLFESKYNEQNALENSWVAGSFQKMTGYTLEEYKNIGGWNACLHKDDVEIHNTAIKDLHRNKKVFVEVRTYHKNGKIIWIRNSCSPIWDPIQQKIIGITGAVKDITEEKRQQLIRQIQYNISNAIVNVKNTNKLFSFVRTELLQLIDASNFFVAFYNENKDLLTSVVDYNKDKVISWYAEKSITGLVIEANKKIFIHKKEILSLAKSKKIKLSGEVPEVWLGVPLHMSGKVFGAIVIQSYNDPDAYDKSSIELIEVIASQLSLFIERDKAEKDALRLSRAIVQSPVSVVITNVEGDIEYVNPMFEKNSGYAFEEVFGENPRILNSKQQSPEFYMELWETILSGKDWHGEFHNKKKNGEFYWENAIISPIENEKEEITHFVAIKEDITEKKKMLEEIITSKEQAISSEKIKTEFLAQMSHEIRSPLNVIMSFIELIKGELDGNLTPDMEDSFQSIDSASSRIIRTIDLILNMTDLQLGSYIISLVEIDVVSMLKRVKGEYLKSANNKGLELRLELEFNRKKITSDEYALIQIVSNLVDNAIKYTDIGYVSIVARKDVKNGLIIKVNDTGIGMKQEFLPKIFSSFTQEEQGYSRTFDGNGLGMALVKNYCEVISADISVDSIKGKGTTFTLIVPNLKK